MKIRKLILTSLQATCVLGAASIFTPQHAEAQSANRSGLQLHERAGRAEHRPSQQKMAYLGPVARVPTHASVVSSRSVPELDPKSGAGAFALMIGSAVLLMRRRTGQ